MGQCPSISCLSLSLARLADPGCLPCSSGGMWLSGEGRGQYNGVQCRRMIAARGARPARVWTVVLIAQPPLPAGKRQGLRMVVQAHRGGVCDGRGGGGARGPH